MYVYIQFCFGSLSPCCMCIYNLALGHSPHEAEHCLFNTSIFACKVVQVKQVIKPQPSFPVDSTGYHDFMAAGGYTTNVPDSTFQPPPGMSCQHPPAPPSPPTPPPAPPPSGAPANVAQPQPDPEPTVEGPTGARKRHSTTSVATARPRPTAATSSQEAIQIIAMLVPSP